MVQPHVISDLCIHIDCGFVPCNPGFDLLGWTRLGLAPLAHGPFVSKFGDGLITPAHFNIRLGQTRFIKFVSALEAHNGMLLAWLVIYNID